MAREGKTFKQFYTGAPICSPARSALLTGRLPVRSGVTTAHAYPEDLLFRVFYPVSRGGLPESEVTIAAQLSAANYTSSLIGKW